MMTSHRNGTRLLSLAILAALLCSPAFADSLMLRNGQRVQGKFVAGTQGVIAFAAEGTTQYYNVTEVLALTFDEDIGQTSRGHAHKLPDSGVQVQPQRFTPRKTSRRPQLKTVSTGSAEASSANR